MFFEVEQVGDFRAAPAVDALVVIADDAEVAMNLRERMDEFELRGVRVLILVHHDVAIFGAAGFEGVGMFAEQAQREQNQIVEVHGVAGVQRGFVALGDVLRERADVFVAEDRRAFATVLELAQHREHRAGVGLLALGGDAAQNLFDRAQLFGLVVDDEVAFVAKLLDVLPQDADAEGVEGGDGRAVGLGVRRKARGAGQKFRDAFLHLAGGFVGEGDGQNILRRDAARDHVRDAVGDDARLARARTSENEHRTIDGLGGLTLGRVERVQIHHARAESSEQANGRKWNGAQRQTICQQSLVRGVFSCAGE